MSAVAGVAKAFIGFVMRRLFVYKNDIETGRELSGVKMAFNYDKSCMSIKQMHHP